MFTSLILMYLAGAQVNLNSKIVCRCYNCLELLCFKITVYVQIISFPKSDHIYIVHGNHNSISFH